MVNRVSWNYQCVQVPNSASCKISSSETIKEDLRLICECGCAGTHWLERWFNSLPDHFKPTLVSWHIMLDVPNIPLLVNSLMSMMILSLWWGHHLPLAGLGLKKSKGLCSDGNSFMCLAIPRGPRGHVLRKWILEQYRWLFFTHVSKDVQVVIYVNIPFILNLKTSYSLTRSSLL